LRAEPIRNAKVKMSQMVEASSRGERATLGALFFGFLQVSLWGFGGGLVWARRIAVEKCRWISEPEFADIVSLCQFMPGPNIVGIAVCVGAKTRGLVGTIAALCGFLVIPWSVGLALGVLYLEYAHLAVLQHILGGAAPAAAGLLIATGIRLLMPHSSRPAALVFAALAFGLMAFGKLPLLLVLFVLVPASIAAAGITTARA
jgi:chromate transporter